MVCGGSHARGSTVLTHAHQTAALDSGLAVKFAGNDSATHICSGDPFQLFGVALNENMGDTFAIDVKHQCRLELTLDITQQCPLIIEYRKLHAEPGFVAACCGEEELRNTLSSEHGLGETAYLSSAIALHHGVLRQLRSRSG